MLTRSNNLVYPSAALLAGLALVCGCEESSQAPTTDRGSQGTNDNGRSPSGSDLNRSTRTPPATDPSGERSAASEREVLAYLAALDQSEVEIGRAALERQLAPAVHDYAQMLVDSHAEHAQATERTGTQLNVTPDRTPDVAAFSDRQAEALAALATLDDEAFARQFIDKMISGHREAIDLLDNKLLPAANSPALRDFLNATRATLQQHSDRARALQNP